MRLLLVAGDRVLLLQQTRQNGGNFTLLGGTVEAGETPIESLVRETQEEANIKIDPAKLELVHVLHKKTFKGPRVNLYFMVSDYEGEIKNLEDHKFKNIKWFKMDSLPSTVTDTVRLAIEGVRKGRRYGELTVR